MWDWSGFGEAESDEVCATHGRFLPCRKDAPHFTTSDPRWVRATHKFQKSESNTWVPEEGS